MGKISPLDLSGVSEKTRRRLNHLRFKVQVLSKEEMGVDRFLKWIIRYVDSGFDGAAIPEV